MTLGNPNWGMCTCLLFHLQCVPLRVVALCTVNEMCRLMVYCYLFLCNTCVYMYFLYKLHVLYRYIIILLFTANVYVLIPALVVQPPLGWRAMEAD